MPQLQLPIFGNEIKLINNLIGFEKRDGKVFYFHGQLPIFSHSEDDLESFRFITSQIIINGNATQREVSEAFGVTLISVKRSVKKLKERGLNFFFKKPVSRSPHILIPEVVDKIEQFLTNGDTVPDIAHKLNIQSDTIRKAIRLGKIKKK